MGNRLRLLILLLIAAAAVFAVVKSIPAPPQGENQTVSLDVENNPHSADVGQTDEPVPPRSSDAADPEIKTETTEAKSQYPVMPDVPYVPPSGSKPLLALIVDDGGYQLDLTKRIAALGIPLTWAILPDTKFAVETAALADSKKIPYLLHLPMQAQSDKDGSKELLP